MTRKPDHHSSNHYRIVAEAIAYLRTHRRQQPSLAEVAAAVGMSEHHLQRVFAAWAGISPKRFLQYLTKEHAVRSLRQSADVLSAALESGLSGPGRLHDLLVTCEAMTPGEIRAWGRGVEVGYGFGETPFGEALLAWTARGVCYLGFCDADPMARLTELQERWSAATLVRSDRLAVNLSERIFFKQSRSGELRLLLSGSNFQIKVWEALLTTSRAQLLSYSELAAMSGNPKAQRAAGSALAANQIAFLIPCHRVIRESGEVGSYRWGSDRKMAIHAWESGKIQ